MAYVRAGWYDQIHTERAGSPAPATSPAPLGKALAVLSAVPERVTDGPQTWRWRTPDAARRTPPRHVGSSAAAWLMIRRRSAGSRSWIVAPLPAFAAAAPAAGAGSGG